MSVADIVDLVTRQEKALRPRGSAIRWTAEEDAFLISNMGHLSETEIAVILGRSLSAVHLRWSRDLFLRAPSKSPDIVTSHQASIMLGIDGHKTSCWVDCGFIPARILPGGRRIRVIDRQVFLRWAITPVNWIYFDIHRVADPHLHRLIHLRSLRWNNEWWPTKRVAEFHGVDVGDVKRYIQFRRLPATQAKYSMGGRHVQMGWANWFVLRSDAIACRFWKQGDFYRNRHTHASDAWMIKAHAMGWSSAAIARSMKQFSSCTVQSRLRKLGVL